MERVARPPSYKKNFFFLECFLDLLVEQTKTLYEPDYDLSQAVT